MTVPAAPAVVRFFTRVLAARRTILIVCVLLGALGVYGATRIPDDNAIGTLMVTDDPNTKATAAFEKIFPEGDHALLMLETADPLSGPALRGADLLEQNLRRIAGVEPESLLSIYRSANPDTILNAAGTTRVRQFARGTRLVSRAGLLGPHFLGIALELHVRSPADRDRMLAAIDAATEPLLRIHGGSFDRIRHVGSPWLDAWLERETQVATQRSMPLFGLFLVVLVFALYRSWRALMAIVITLAVVVAIAMGLAALTGWTHTIVSSLVPLTVLVTATATLVYIHSRYIDRAGDGTGAATRADLPDLATHHAQVLANKFLPCTASIFATAVGFAALSVSNIRPVSQMGLWTAAGLIVAWLASFSLFPALQQLLRTPTQSERRIAGRWYPHFVEWWLPLTRSLRWPLVGIAVAGMVAGAIALVGIPGHIRPLALQTDTLTYIDPRVAAAQDTRYFEAQNGLGVYQLWLKVPHAGALDPQFLRAVDQLVRQLEKDPRITAVDGPTSLLRWARYVQSGADELPMDPQSWNDLAGQLEQILLTTPGARGYVDLNTLGDIRLSIRGRDRAFGDIGVMRRYIERTWQAVQRQQPALADVTAQVVGESVLSDQITLQLVPTLMESFALTASIIFCAFLLVFRSPMARLMAMIPSLFAILSAFMVMRGAAISLNIATILIGSTVLGATENDQVHFFYHFQEGRDAGSTLAALRHAFMVAGKPILFATLINAAGFLALALSPLPPMRQFGTVSSAAFVLALLADFTALPAALWICTRSAKTVRSSP
ncbi:MAG TPA: MMPL family transporter [Steroidobacteraceae bacterium]